MVEADGCGNSLQGDENVLGLGLQLLECLPSMPEGLEALASIHSPVLDTHAASALEVEAVGSEVQDHPQLHKEQFKATMDYIAPHI